MHAIRLNDVASVQASAIRAAREYQAGAPAALAAACRPYDRRIPGLDMGAALDACAPTGKCRDGMIVGTAVVLAGVANTIVNFPVPMRLRIDSILVVTSTAAGFGLHDFVINNMNAWGQGQVLHSAVFAPGGDANTAFQSDIIAPGSLVQMQVDNLDAVNPQTIWIHLKGPGS